MLYSRYRCRLSPQTKRCTLGGIIRIFYTVLFIIWIISAVWLVLLCTDLGPRAKTSYDIPAVLSPNSPPYHARIPTNKSILKKDCVFNNAYKGHLMFRKIYRKKFAKTTCRQLSSPAPLSQQQKVTWKTLRKSHKGKVKKTIRRASCRTELTHLSRVNF